MPSLAHSPWSNYAKTLGCLFIATAHNDPFCRRKKPSRRDVADYLCEGAAPQLRLVRLLTPEGQIRGVATNLPARDFPAEVFGDLYHQRWHIEEAYNRLKHQAKLERVSGLAQPAWQVEVYAKVRADHLGFWVCQGASAPADWSSRQRNGNRAYAAPCLQRALNHLSPIEALKAWRKKSPELFVKRVYKQAGLDT